MDKRQLSAIAVVLLMAGAAPASALDNAAGADGGCMCACVLGDGWMNVDSLVYATPAGGCSALSNRTCNVEDPTQNNAVRSGRLANCAPRITMEQSVVPGLQNGGLADPGHVQGDWTFEVAPLQGGALQQQ